ncbi:DNA polymerase epsilon subunit 2 [Quaeritorhiza haematococci]|nr:DNA polymerase epsilon subunit 2 [Quaeritorhiza haematococci]
MAKLRTLFEGFSNAVIPLAFVLTGNFTSIPHLHDGKSIAKYKECFDSLADLISSFPSLAQQAHFIFIPGLKDAGETKLVPRPRIPSFFTKKVESKVPKAMFMSNPCRIKYCTQEIVIYREDLLNKMHRNCILELDQKVEPDDRNHLVLADQYETYCITYEDCQTINPGSFSTNGYKFLMYQPSSRHVEKSQVP